MRDFSLLAAVAAAHYVSGATVAPRQDDNSTVVDPIAGISLSPSMPLHTWQLKVLMLSRSLTRAGLHQELQRVPVL